MLGRRPRELESAGPAIHFQISVEWGNKECLGDGYSCDRPIYRYKLSNLAFEWKRGQRQLCSDKLSAILLKRSEFSFKTRLPTASHPLLARILKSAYHLSELAGQTNPVVRRILLLVRIIQPASSAYSWMVCMAVMKRQYFIFQTTAGLISQLEYITVKKIRLKKSYFS